MNEDYLSLMANVGVIPYADKGDVGNKKPEDLTKCKLVFTGDLVINSMNYGIGSYGLSSYTGICSPVYIVLKPKLERIEERFAFRILENKAFQGFAQSHGNGILEHRAAINWDILKGIGVPLPPVQEQQAILQLLDHETAKIDALVAEQEKLIALLQEKRQAVISHAVTKGLDPNVPMKDSGVEWLGEVPAHWEIRRVRALSSFLTSGPRGWSERVSEVGSKFIQSGDLTDDLSIAFDNAKRVAVNDDAEAARTKLADGDVVVCITGAKTGNVAVCGTVAEDAYVNQHLCLIRPRPDILSDLLAIYLKSDAGQRYFAVAQYGLKQGMSLENIKEAPVPVPPIDEQRQIVDVAQDASRSIGALVNEARTAITLLQERRTSLISAAVTGQIDVRGLAGASNAPDSIAVSA
ncbi:MAG: restriction endonuclease subunit S [Pusillimonas sp.]